MPCYGSCSPQCLCPACVADFLDYATEQNILSELAAADPHSDPRHREATDKEWQRHVVEMDEPDSWSWNNGL